MGSRLPFETFKKIYSTVPRLCVEVLVINKNGVVLSLRSIDPYKGLWHISGGTVYFGESLHEAVKRVSYDELGVNVTVIKQHGFIEYPKEHLYRGFGWPVGIVFLVKTDEKTFRGSEQGEEIKIFDKLPDKIIPEQRDFLKANFFNTKTGFFSYDNTNAIDFGE